ncbi:MAG: sulfotransferase domain-containing protein [Planctomycetota bacterium]
MADYLRCARPGRSLLPLALRSVIHNHWDYHPKLKRTVYLYRDGRDVMTSMYFYRIRSMSQYKGNSRARKHMEHILGRGFDPDNTAINLPGFMAYEFENPKSAGRHNWATHVLAWHQPSRTDRLLYLSYEQLIENTTQSLAKAIEHVSPIETDPRLIARTVDHYKMQSITGRKPGTESRGDFVRKGIAGDWQNHFTKEAAEVFNHYAGEALVKLGYETDTNWWIKYANQSLATPS